MANVSREISKRILKNQSKGVGLGGFDSKYSPEIVGRTFSWENVYRRNGWTRSVASIQNFKE